MHQRGATWHQRPPPAWGPLQNQSSCCFHRTPNGILKPLWSEPATRGARARARSLCAHTRLLLIRSAAPKGAFCPHFYAPGAPIWTFLRVFRRLFCHGLGRAWLRRRTKDAGRAVQRMQMRSAGGAVCGSCKQKRRENQQSSKPAAHTCSFYASNKNRTDINVIFL